MTTSASNGHAPRDSAPRDSGPRVCVAYSFYRLRATAHVLPTEDRRLLADQFENAVHDASQHLGILRSYSLVGLRPDADLLLWQAAETPEQLQSFAAALRQSELWPHLEISHQYLAMTRRSQYVETHVHEGQDGRRTHVQPAGSPYLFVYPFVKTRAWYALPFDERQRIMSEHIKIGHKYPRVKINTTYSFGLDDQEFVVAFEGESPGEFLDLVMELRSSESSQYTLRDTPAFTAVAKPIGEALSLALGLGTGALVPA
jgi:chlorite dismutase